MIDKGRGLLRNLSLRRKLLLTFLLLLLVIAAGITVSVNYYNQRFINHLMVESNRQMMREMNAQLDSIYDQVNQVYLTRISMKYFSKRKKKRILRAFRGSFTMRTA